MISDKILPPQSLQTKGKGNPEYTANQKKFLEGEGIAFEEKQPKPEEPPLLGSLPQITPEPKLPAVAAPDTPQQHAPNAKTAPEQAETGKKKRKRSRKKKTGDTPPAQETPERADGFTPTTLPPVVAANPPHSHLSIDHATPAPQPSTMLNIHHSVPEATKPAQPQQVPEDPTLLKIR
jgi:hypothetical protein